MFGQRRRSASLIVSLLQDERKCVRSGDHSSMRLCDSQGHRPSPIPFQASEANDDTAPAIIIVAVDRAEEWAEVSLGLAKNTRSERVRERER